MHLKPIQCSKPCYSQHELISLDRSCSDHPVTNVSDGDSNVLANWLHDGAKPPLPGWRYEKEYLFPAVLGLSSLREKNRKRRGDRVRDCVVGSI